MGCGHSPPGSGRPEGNRSNVSRLESAWRTQSAETRQSAVCGPCDVRGAISPGISVLSAPEHPAFPAFPGPPGPPGPPGLPGLPAQESRALHSGRREASVRGEPSTVGIQDGAGDVARGIRGRNTVGPAISSGCPSAPSGSWWRRRLPIRIVLDGSRQRRFDDAGPIAFTRTPNGAHSVAAVFASWRMPALVIEYTDWPGSVTMERIDEREITLPDFCGHDAACRR